MVGKCKGMDIWNTSKPGEERQSQELITEDNHGEIDVVNEVLLDLDQEYISMPGQTCAE